MTERRYLVLEGEFDGTFAAIGPLGRPTRGGPLRGGGLAGAVPTGAPLRGDVTKISMRTEKMTEAQAANQRRDRKTLAMCEPIPLALIEPLTSQEDADNDDGDSWGIAASGVDQSQYDGSGVKVAVIDTGIDLEHPAFFDIKNRIEAKDFTGSPSHAHDTRGHGSHCAGTIFGQDVGGRRIGVARNVEQAFVAKVFADQGDSDTMALFDALLWANRSGANIISMSLGFDLPGMVSRLVEWYDLPENIAASQALVAFANNLRAFDTMVAMMESQAQFGGGHALLIAASGNESDRKSNLDYVVSASLPSSAKGIVPVGAYGCNGDAYSIAEFSNIDALVTAPGVDILSAKANSKGLKRISGTSMACPHVAGVGALWWQHVEATKGNANPAKVYEEMITAVTRNKLPLPYNEADFGRGRVMAPT